MKQETGDFVYMHSVAEQIEKIEQATGLDDLPVFGKDDEGVEIVGDLTVLSDSVQVALVKKCPKLVGTCARPCEEAQLVAVRADGDLLALLPFASELVKQEAVTQCPQAIRHIAKPSKYVQRIAVNLGYVDKYYKISEEVQLETIAKDVRLISRFENPFKSVQLAVASQDGKLAAGIRGGQDVDTIDGKAVFSEQVQFTIVRDCPHAVELLNFPTEKIQFWVLVQNISLANLFDEISESVQMSLAKRYGARNCIVNFPSPCEELQELAVSVDGTLIKFLQNASEKIQMAAVKNNTDALQFISEPTLATQMYCVTKKGMSIRHLDHGQLVTRGTPSLQVQRAAVENDIYAFHFIRKPHFSIVEYCHNLWENGVLSEEMQLAIVKLSIENLAIVKCPTLKTQMYCVTRDGTLIKHITEGECVRNKLACEKVQTEAILNDVYSFLEFQTESKTVVRTCASIVECLSDKEKLKFVKHCPDVLEFFKHVPEAFQLECVSLVGNCVQYFEDPSLVVQMAAVKADPYSLAYIDKPRLEVQMYCVEQVGYLIKFISDGEGVSTVGTVPVVSEKVQIAAVKNGAREINGATETVKRYLNCPGLDLDLERRVRDDISLFKELQNPSEEIQDYVATVCPDMILEMTSPSSRVQLSALFRKPSLFKYLDFPSIEAQLHIAKNSPGLFAYLRNGQGVTFKSGLPVVQPEVQSAVVQSERFAIEHLNWPSAEVQAQAVRASAYNIRYCKAWDTDGSFQRLQELAISLDVKNYDLFSEMASKETKCLVKSKKDVPRDYTTPWEAWVALGHGDLTRTEWLKTEECEWDSSTFSAAASRGDLELMKWLRDSGCPWNEYTFACAARHGNLENMKWLKEVGCPWGEDTFEDAAQHGNLENMKWLRSNGCPWNKRTFQAAAKHGNLENMKWLRFGEAEPSEDRVLLASGCPWDSCTFSVAARHGNLENMKWLYESGLSWDNYTFYHAADCGNLEIMKWLHDVGCPWSECVFKAAARHGNLEAVKWLHEAGCPGGKRALEQAASSGNFEMTMWLYSKGFDLSAYSWKCAIQKGGNADLELWNASFFSRNPKDKIFALSAEHGCLELYYKIKDSKWFDENKAPYSFNKAAESGNVDIMKWLKATGHDWDSDTFDTAAEHGNLEAMKWLHSVGCPWYEQTFANSAKFGNLENMKWLHEAGCPWNEWTFEWAAQNGNLEIMKWLKESECPWDERTFYEAAEHGNLEAMKWLHEAGCPWDSKTFNAAAEHGDLEIMKWLRSVGCPWNTDTFDHAALHGNLENMKWLKEAECPWDSWTFCAAAKYGNLENLKWLRSVGCPGGTSALEQAAIDGNLEMTIWLCSKGFDLSNYLFEYIIGKSGNTKLEEWYSRIRSCSFDNERLSLSAEHGCLELYYKIKDSKWFDENKAPYSFNKAAESGNIDIMKWLKATGHDWDSSTFQRTANHGNVENLKWLKENGCPWDPITFTHSAPT